MKSGKEASYNKVKSCIKSCKTKQQLQSANRLINLYAEMYEDPHYTCNLYIDYNILFFKFKELESHIGS